jgi:glycine/D-amino acid oxidase-like deaminating enzyme
VLGDTAGFHRRPSLYFASHDAEVDALRQEHALRRRHRFEVEWLARADLERRYGFSAPAALYARGSGEIDCYRFGHQLLAAATACGARVYDRTEVERVRHEKSGVILRVSGGHTIRARRLVVAAGYETAHYLRRRTGHLHSTWAFVSEPLAGFGAWEDRCLIWETARPYLYLRTTDDNRVLAGGEDEPYSTRHEDTSRLARKTARLRQRVQALFPDLSIEPAYSWAGVFADTEDGLPFIGSTHEHADTWFALGYGGNGITFSAIAADLIRDAYVGRRNVDAEIFAFNRRRATRPR